MSHQILELALLTAELLYAAELDLGNVVNEVIKANLTTCQALASFMCGPCQVHSSLYLLATLEWF